MKRDLQKEQLRTAIPRRRAAPLALLLALATPACLFDRYQHGVSISSEPPGAEVVVNGEPSGFVTPSYLDLARSEWHRVDVRLSGYETATRMLAPNNRRSAIPWTRGNIGVQTFVFPILLPTLDLIAPVRIDTSLSPSRVHVRLELDESAAPTAALLELPGIDATRP